MSLEEEIVYQYNFRWVQYNVVTSKYSIDGENSGSLTQADP